MSETIHREQFEAALKKLATRGYVGQAPNAEKERFLAAINPLVEAVRASLGAVSPAGLGISRGEESDKLHDACAAWLKKFGGK